MSDFRAQAGALLELLSGQQHSAHADELGPATAECAAGLIEQGEPESALVLLDAIGSIAARDHQVGPLTLDVIKVWALLRLDRVAEAMDHARQGLERHDSSERASRLDRIALQVLEAGCLWRTHHISEAVRRLESARLELLQRADCRVTCLCALELAATYYLSGDRRLARAMTLEALVASRRLGSRYFEGVARLNLAMLERKRGRWALAIEETLEARELFHGLQNARFERRCLHEIGILEWKRGQLSRVIDASEQAYAGAVAPSDAESERWLASLLRSLALTHLGRFEDARKSLTEDPEWQIPSKFSRRSLLTAEYLGDIELEQGNAQQAMARFEPTLTAAMALVPRGDIVAELKRRMAECHLLQGDAAKALVLAQDALAHCREIQERYDEAATHRILALAHAALGEHESARKAFDAGFAEYDEIETPYEWGKLWLAYGDWLSADASASYRNLSAGREAYAAAIDHFDRIGAEYRLTQARERLGLLDERMRDEGELYRPTSGKIRPARRPRHSTELLRRSQWALETFGLVTRSGPLLEMLAEIATVAASDLPVLVLGESGTGKELIAKGVHLLSGRTGEFMAINCSAIPEAMLEGEFFGYMKGSFTNAIADKPGLFEVAHDGTVFLDEIGEMSPDLQAKLLRYLESGTLRRVGATRDLQVDTRIVAATNRELSSLRSGTGFRSDLYYRLAHAVYELPPMRARGDDIELLIEHFLDVFNRANGKRSRFSAAAMSRLIAHAWPGNVRELKAVVHKLVVAAAPGAVFTPRDLPILEGAEAANNFIGETIANEKKRIIAALEQAHFVKTEAAHMLRISRTTLLSKMKRMGIEG